jgi:hypothetical protein
MTSTTERRHLNLSSRQNQYLLIPIRWLTMTRIIAHGLAAAVRGVARFPLVRYVDRHVFVVLELLATVPATTASINTYLPFDETSVSVAISGGGRNFREAQIDLHDARRCIRSDVP